MTSPVFADSAFLETTYVDTTYLTVREARKLIWDNLGLRHVVERLWEADHSCRFCGVDIPWAHRATLEHIIPRSKGGKATPENLTIVCAPCNQAKADRTPREWLELLEMQAAVMRRLIELNGL